MFKTSQFCNKINSLYADIGECNKDKNINYVPHKKAWLVDLQKGTITCMAFKKVCHQDSSIYFIFGCVTDLVGLGLIENFESYPKYNFTGVCLSVNVDDRLRFIKRLMPKAKKIGLVHSEMPQSICYNQWLKNSLKKDEFRDLTIYFRSVQFVKGMGGHKRMALLAEKHVNELATGCCFFLSAHDQMGIQESYARMISQTTSKHWWGVEKLEEIKQWGAVMSITPYLPD